MSGSLFGGCHSGAVLAAMARGRVAEVLTDALHQFNDDEAVQRVALECVAAVFAHAAPMQALANEAREVTALHGPVTAKTARTHEQVRVCPLD